jgi:hypothetical protein
VKISGKKDLKSMPLVETAYAFILYLQELGIIRKISDKKDRSNRPLCGGSGLPGTEGLKNSLHAKGKI